MSSAKTRIQDDDHDVFALPAGDFILSRETATIISVFTAEEGTEEPQPQPPEQVDLRRFHSFQLRRAR
jgi:hypothetical protein